MTRRSEEREAQASPRWGRAFSAIFGGLVLSRLGSAVAHFSLIWWLTDLTGSAAVLASASALALIPQVILGPLAGAYVDRWKRRVVMIAADGLVAVSTLVLVALFVLGMVETWHIFAIMFVRSCFTSFHWPASQAATTMLVPERHLTRVAGFNQSLQADHFSLQDLPAEGSQAVFFPAAAIAGVLRIACPLDPAAIQQPLERGVERAGAQGHAPITQLAHILHD